MNTSNTAVSPLIRGESFTLSALADTFMACYQGRDPSFGNRLSFIVQQLGHKVASEIDADDVDDFLDALRARGKLFNRGGTKEAVKLSPPINHLLQQQSIATVARCNRFFLGRVANA